MLKNEKDELILVEIFNQILKGESSQLLTLPEFEKIISYFKNENRYTEALSACQLASKQFPYSFEIFVLQSEILIESGKYGEALVCLEKAENFQPNDIEILRLKSDLFILLNKKEKAIETLEYIVQYDLESPETLLKLANTNQTFGRFNEAIRCYSEAVSSFEWIDDFEIIAFDLIECYENLNKLDDLITLLEQLVNEKPYSAIRWYQLGFILNIVGQYKKAFEAFDYTTIIDDTYADGWFQKGHACMNREDYKQAIACYIKVSELEKDCDVELYCHLGAAYEKEGEVKLAKEYYNKAIEIDQKYPDAWFGLGVCMYKQAKWLQAVHFLKKAVEYSPFISDYWLFLAKAEYELGSIVAAEEAFEKASSITPDLPEVWLTWSEVYYNEGEIEHAIDIIEEGLEENPDEPDLMYRSVAYYFTAGQLQKTLRQLEFALLVDYESHEQLYDFFEDLNIQKKLCQLVNHLKGDADAA